MLGRPYPISCFNALVIKGTNGGAIENIITDLMIAIDAIPFERLR